jgi:hypothetical protein
MLASLPCVTQAEADERARAAEMGVSPPAEEKPAACALIAEPPRAARARRRDSARLATHTSTKPSVNLRSFVELNGIEPSAS